MIIQHIRDGKFSKVIASYLAIQLILQIVQPTAMWALTGGPKQPEFNSFTPIGTSDMVDLASGDFNYNIPIMDVGGYPLNLSYQSGVTMDQEASWVGLGWNLNVGQINRNVRGIPDDFKGDEIEYTDELKENKTIGVAGNFNAAIFGFDPLTLGVGLGLDWNNYTGNSINFSIGPSFQLNKNISVGFNLNGSAANGASVSPNIGISASLGEIEGIATSLGSSVGVTYNSRQGLSSFNMSASLKGELKGTFIKGSKSVGTNASISFAKPTYTPSKRVSYENSSFSFSFAAGLEGIGIEPQGQLTGYVSTQKIKNPFRKVKAFGYEHTDFATTEDVIDFNRENDRTISLNTNVLASTNYTYDLYSIQGQGISGQFRPHRSQVGFVYDNFVSDHGDADAIGGEIGVGNLFHGGLDFTKTKTSSSTGLWEQNNKSLNRLREKYNDNSPAYEKTYFKSVGQLDVDIESMDILTKKLGGEKAINLGVEGNGKLKSNYQYETLGSNRAVIKHQISSNNNEVIKRNNRAKRNQSIQKLTFDQARERLDKFIEYRDDISSIRKGHHTAGFKVLQPDGANYIYGFSVYNAKKVEASFDVSGERQSSLDKRNGVINTSVKKANNQSDRFLNKIETPAYPHTYLLTSVLSTDYEDINNNGPDDEDLGSYTKFTYSKGNNGSLYKWRVPYDYRYSTYNKGLESLKNDQKANYLYGEKELYYVNTIETKTHIAIFDLSDREFDGFGAQAENSREFNGLSNVQREKGKQKKIDSIRLYSKPDYLKSLENPSHKAKPIKVAHFNYSNDLCKGVNNDPNFNGVNGKGKLTLKKVWFTYQNSNMGQYTPYEFEYYNETNADALSYHIKSYDIWGNYKPFTSDNTSNIGPHGTLTAAEFPYVNQENRSLQNTYASAWTLKTVNLPSGGKIDLELEADSYNYVQDKKAMRMFKILGVGNTPTPNSTQLYDSKIDGASHVYIPLDEEDKNNNSFDVNQFRARYIGDNIEKPIYFRFMVNMSKRRSGSKYDYITGYLKIHKQGTIHINKNAGYAAIPLEYRPRGGGGLFSDNKPVNPISKSGWFFARKYLNNLVFTGNEYTGGDIKSYAKSLAQAVGSFKEIFTGPNGVLDDGKIAHYCIPNKSWIRLQNPGKEKLGGGVRVKSLKMYDNWKDMTGNNNHLNKYYGQEYYYTAENGESSGVATFEPNASKENPLISPLYDEDDRSLAPASENYVETPIGATFYPSPKVTYSRVQVKNLNNESNNGNGKVKLHASGSVVTEFWTSRNFPTISKLTTITENDRKYKSPGAASPLRLFSKEIMTLSQGFCVITNDMDSKQRQQSVYAENLEDEDISSPNKTGALISRVKYDYNIAENNPNQLENQVTTIDEYGEVLDNVIGVDYDVINDFRESTSATKRTGARANVAGFSTIIPPIIIVPTAFPEINDVRSNMYSASTTKVIHKRGILKKKTAYDLGATVTTENLAWDAVTGEVLVTKTDNEYDDSYYNLTYPSHWYYKGMGLASKNIGIKGRLNKSNQAYFSNGFGLTPGDKLLVTNYTGPIIVETEENGVEEYDWDRLWVVEINSNGVVLMNADGEIPNYHECLNFKLDNVEYEIIKSGYTNQASSSMASITSKTNPIAGDLHNLNNFSGVVNASAIEYSDFWLPQNENGLPVITTEAIDLKSDDTVTDKNKAVLYGFNPYRYNVRGDYKAVASYAYLNKRSDFSGNNLKNAGEIENFRTFYYINNDDEFDVRKEDWTRASDVTKYNPFGVELENKDALGRYSSAQYGYNYTLPIAVSSNSAYSEMAFDGFEDYSEDPPDLLNYNKKHFDFPIILGERKANIVSNTSHTGKKSIKLEAGKSISLNRGIGECADAALSSNCESEDLGAYIEEDYHEFNDVPVNSNYFSSQSQDIGDETAINVFIESRFVISGRPYSKVEIQVELKHNHEGFHDPFRSHPNDPDYPLTSIASSIFGLNFKPFSIKGFGDFGDIARATNSTFTYRDNNTNNIGELINSYLYLDDQGKAEVIINSRAWQKAQWCERYPPFSDKRRDCSDNGEETNELEFSGKIKIIDGHPNMVTEKGLPSYRISSNLFN